MNKRKTLVSLKKVIKVVSESLRRHIALSIVAGVCFFVCLILIIPLLIVAKKGFYIEKIHTQVVTRPVSSVQSNKSENEDIIIPEVEVADKDFAEDVEIPDSEYEENIIVYDSLNNAISQRFPELSCGIDVSSHNGKIDWKKVAADGVEFVMIRCGYRGYVTGKIVQDAYFEENIRGAAENGIAIGVYFYSTAVNEAEASQEAAWVCKIIDEKAAEGIKLRYPIAYDFEEFYNKKKSRAENLSKQQLTKNTIAFLNYVSESGYTPMLYASKSAVTEYWDFNAIKEYDFWLAHYVDLTNYTGEYAMWQYTSRGKVNGIKGYADFNVSYYLDVYSSELVECTENSVTVYSGYSDNSAESGMLVSGVIYERIRTFVTGWSKIKYDGFVGYVKTDKLKGAEFITTTKTVTVDETTPFYSIAVKNDEYKKGELEENSSVDVTATYNDTWYEFQKDGQKMYFMK